MFVWLDDERPMPSDYTHHVKTAEEAIELLKTGKVEKISLDHDLGRERTGYDVAKWIEQAAFNGSLQPIRIALHTANPVGRENMRQALANAKLYWMGR